MQLSINDLKHVIRQTCYMYHVEAEVEQDDDQTLSIALIFPDTTAITTYYLEWNDEGRYILRLEFMIGEGERDCENVISTTSLGQIMSELLLHQRIIRISNYVRDLLDTIEERKRGEHRET